MTNNGIEKYLFVKINEEKKKLAKTKCHEWLLMY
jgi:hypothetical protein